MNKIIKYIDVFFGIALFLSWFIYLFSNSFIAKFIVGFLIGFVSIRLVLKSLFEQI